VPGIHRALQKAPTRPCVLVLLWIARLVKIESDPLCKAHYFTHPQNGQTLAAYGDYALIENHSHPMHIYSSELRSKCQFVATA
jgi:hypothetical protein